VDLVTEEVEPGVFRVLSGGVRDLESEPTIDRVGDMDLIGTHHSIAAGLDGSVWSFRPEAFYRPGDGDRYDWPDAEDDPRAAMGDIEVGPDGTDEAVRGPRLPGRGATVPGDIARGVGHTRPRRRPVPRGAGPCSCRRGIAASRDLRRADA
jgi:hypothetical protein